jgi:hypothetical protein
MCHHYQLFYSLALHRREYRRQESGWEGLGIFPRWIKKKGKVDPVLNLIKHYAMKAYGGVDV